MRLPLIGILVEFARQLMPGTVNLIRRQRWLATLLFFLSLAASFVLLFSGCATVDPEVPQIEALYQHELMVKVNGLAIRGFGVVPLADKYHVLVIPEGKIDRIIIRTCHRELVFDKPEQGFWNRLTQNNVFTTEITRTPDIEDVASCAMEIDVYEERKKRSGWAVVDFEDRRPEVSLPFHVKCNGDSYSFARGVGVCQSAIGLVQQVIFTEPVLAESVDCPGVFSDKAEAVWFFQMPKGKCTVYFGARRKHANGMRMKARLNLLGYTHVPPVN